MLHSLLITGADLDQRQAQAAKLAQTNLVDHPDILILQPQPSIGISHIRQLEKFLSRKPYQNPQKIVFLPQADKLTLPAQNALLKTLEEPPANSLIILSASHTNILLPTIVSRCQLIKLTSITSELTPAEFKQQQQLFQQIIKSSLGQRINLASQFGSSKQSALDFLRPQLFFLRQQTHQESTSQLVSLLRRLQIALNQIQANTNPKLCLENLFFHYPNSSKIGKINS